MEAQDLFWAYRNNFEKNVIYYTVNSINIRLHAFSASTQLSFLFIFQLLAELSISTKDSRQNEENIQKILQCRQTSWANLWNINSFVQFQT